MARIEIAPPLFGIAECQKNLRCNEAVCAGELLVGMGQRNLTDGGGRLALLEFKRTLRQLERMAAKRDRARRHEHDLFAGLCQRGHVVHQRRQPLGLELARRAVGQQRRADLHDNALSLGPFGPDGRAGVDSESHNCFVSRMRARGALLKIWESWRPRRVYLWPHPPASVNL